MTTTTAGVLAGPTRPIASPRALGIAVAMVVVAASIAPIARALTSDTPATPPPAPLADTATGALGDLPMAWTANTGQTDASVRYLARGLGYGAFLTNSEAVLRLDGAVVRLGFDGAAPAPSLTSEQPLATTVSSFVGSDASTWQAAAETAAVIRYEDLWPGTDLTVRGTGTHLEWDYHLAAGADPAAAGITVAGADAVTIDGDQATLTIGHNELTLAIPAVWQTRGNTRVEREATWRLDGDTLRVIPDQWNPRLPGVIDPTLDWSTYLGGSGPSNGYERATGLAIGTDGSAYVVGTTISPTFPVTTGAFDTGLNGFGDPNAFISKIDPTGSTLIYSTFLSGTNSADARAIAVDGTGAAYVIGSNGSSDNSFPTTPGAYDTTPDAGSDVFVTKLAPSGGSLAYSTLIGGAGSDYATSIAIDASGAAYVAGHTSDTVGTDYPTTAGAYDTTHNGSTDAFATKLNPTGSALVYSTFLGGNLADSAGSIAIDGTGSAYLTGSTQDGATDLPTTPGAYDTVHNGSTDAFATKLNPTGSALVYSTYLGGNLADAGTGIAVDSSGSAYLTGSTQDGATDLPTTAGAYDTVHNGSTDAFATKLNPTGSALVYSTFLGGNLGDAGTGIAVDSSGAAYLTGTTADGTTDYPTTPGAFDPSHNGDTDSFVTKLDATGSALAFSTFLGGSGDQLSAGLVVDASGAASVAGYIRDGATYSTTPGSLEPTPLGGEDAFVTKLATDGATLSYSTMLGSASSTVPGDYVSDVAVDATGVYVVGTAGGDAFPTTPGAFDTTHSGNDAFVAKLDPDGSSLLWSTFLGGDGSDSGVGLAVDGSGNVYVTGSAQDAGTDFPTTPGAYDTAHNGALDAFAAKLNPAGTSLLYSSLLGGSGADAGLAIAIDGTGSAYLAVSTSDAVTDLPTTAGAYDTTPNGVVDAAVAKLNPTGASLIYSTLLGGTGYDFVRDIAVDAGGSALIVGQTDDAAVDFPTTAGALRTTHNGGQTDGFVTRVNPTGTALVYSTFLGSAGFNVHPLDAGGDWANAVALDAAGNAYVTGATWYSPSPPFFPTTTGAYDTTPGSVDSFDAFVTKLTPAGALTYSTFLGGTGSDFGEAIAVDTAGSAYVAGTTRTGFPTTPGASDASANGGQDGFFSRIDPTGSALTYSTYHGGARDDTPTGVVAAPDGRIVLVGNTRSDNLPTTGGAFDTAHVAGLYAGFVSVFDMATPAVGGCTSNTTVSAQISMYPANPGAQSGLQVSCRFDTTTGAVPTSWTVHDFNVAQYHNGAARSVTNVSAIPAGATTFTLTSFAGTSAWVNRPITSLGVAGLAPRTFVRSISGAGVVTLNLPTNASIPAGTTFKIDNGIARSVVDGVTTAGTTLTSATAAFTAADVGLSVAGTPVPEGTTIASVTNGTTVVLSQPVFAAATSQTISFGSTLVTTSARVANDAANTSTTVINSPAARWRPDDVGLRVTGAGIPANTYVLSVAGSNATTTGGLTPNVAPQTITIGEPSVTAPTNGEQAGTYNAMLDTDPIRFRGNDECSAGSPEAVVIGVKWNNPGSFQGTGAGNTQPAGTRAIGQLFIDTLGRDYSAFVIERGGLTPGDPIGVAHYDLVLPETPFLYAMCPGFPSPGYGFSFAVHALTATQSTLAPGTGRPGTAQNRSIVGTPGVGYSATAYVTSNDPSVATAPISDYRRLCVYPSGPVPVDFACGAG